MKLKLPLHHYDEAGRVKPPLMLYVIFVFLLRSIFVFVGSVSLRQDGSELLALFYPLKQDLFIALGIAIPTLLLFVLISAREKLWKSNNTYLLKNIRYLLGILLLADMAVHIIMVSNQHFAFSWTNAIVILLAFSMFVYVINSQHIRTMEQDWRLPH